MMKAEQIPWPAKEQLGRWLASGASHEECIAAAINAWPGVETKGTPMFPTLIRTIILPLPMEKLE